MVFAVSEGKVERAVGDVVQLVKGDITELEVEAFVYYAQHDLALGSGIGGAISVRGGPAVQKELSTLGPLETGDAVVTGAGKLKADWIIHAVGPRFSEGGLEGKLRKTMESALARAEERGLKRIALPAMGAGYYGVAPAVSARVMLEVIAGHAARAECPEAITICLLDTPQMEAFQAALAAAAGGEGS
jgi:O-acetyl-ADP-ribose deacetylase (regulator of RNase III)